jgi:hypothetical protein
MQQRLMAAVVKPPAKLVTDQEAHKTAVFCSSRDTLLLSLSMFYNKLTMFYKQAECMR